MLGASWARLHLGLDIAESEIWGGALTGCKRFEEVLRVMRGVVRLGEASGDDTT